MHVQVKRIYDDAADDDGYRVLIDRMWPRGVAKHDARLDAWPKELAPSNELRRWFGHDRERWDEFRKAYRAELDDCDQEVIDELRQRASKDRMTLLFAARDTECNNAVVFADYLEGKR